MCSQATTSRRGTLRAVVLAALLTLYGIQVGPLLPTTSALRAVDGIPLFTGEISSLLGDDADRLSDATLDQINTGALHHEQPDAMYVLAILKFYGQRVDRDVAGAVRLLKNLATRHTHRDAEFALGMLYATGVDAIIPRNDRASATWLANSANRGHADAMWMLATLYSEGRCVSQDIDRAVTLLRDAVDRHDNPHAMFHLGTMYEYGRGVERDPRRAAELYTRAHERHVLDATYYLALLYGSGRGVRKNSKEALRLLNAAADRGHATAMLRLGEIHADGDSGVTIDYGSALHYFKRAAASSDARVNGEAQRRVSELQWVLTQADELVQQQERVLGAPLRVQVATVEVSG